MVRTNVLAVVAAALVTAASVGVAVGLGAPAVALSGSADADARANPHASASASAAALQNPLGDLTGLIDRIDAILESVVDLLRTLNELFRLVGAGEAEN